MENGLFIVLEGIDGAGTSTQTQLITKQLRLMGYKVFDTHEPTEGKIGKMIREIIRSDGKSKPSWMTMTLLFSADRLEHVDNEIVPNIIEGTHVVCDRYYYSTLAYQHLSNQLPNVSWIEWIKTVGQFSTVPDLTFILDIDAEAAAERMQKRRKPKDVYENLPFQKKLSKFYANIEKHFPSEKIIHIDGSQEVEYVTAKILHYILEYVETKKILDLQ